LQRNVATLFRWIGKRIQYFAANIFRTLYTKFCGYVEDVIKHFKGFSFLLHSVQLYNVYSVGLVMYSKKQMMKINY